MGSLQYTLVNDIQFHAIHLRYRVLSSCPYQNYMLGLVGTPPMESHARYLVRAVVSLSMTAFAMKRLIEHIPSLSSIWTCFGTGPLV